MVEKKFKPKKNTTRKLFALVFLASFIVIGMALAFLAPVIAPHNLANTTQTPISTSQGTYTVNVSADLTALNDQWDFDEHVEIAPTAHLVGTLTNFSQDTSLDFIIQSSAFDITLTLTQVNVSRTMEVRGAPIMVQLTDCWIGYNLLLYNSPNLTLTNVHILGNKFGTTTAMIIGTANIDVDGLWVEWIDIEVTGGNIELEDTNISTNGLTLHGFDSVTLTDINVTDDCNLSANGNTGITGCSVTGRTTLTAGQSDTTFTDSTVNELYVYSTSITTLQNTPVTTLVELIDPTIVVESAAINVPYAFFFQPSKTVDIDWTGSDNIQGAGYEVSYNISIYQDGQLVATVSQSTSSYSLVMTTASTYILRIICIDAQDNVSTETVMTVSPAPNLLWFIVMIVGIAGAAIGMTLFLYWRKQRQWQKTTLMEIPTE